MREVRMFGGLSFMVNEKLVVAVAGAGDLLVRIDPTQHEELTALPGAGQAEMGAGRGMGPGWVSVSAASIEAEDNLAFWIDAAMQYNARVAARTQ
jgi:TfoX/Sxy family transcriptional regulator of competence genes